MEVAQSRGLTLCPMDGLSDSDDETPEDLVLSIHTPRRRQLIDFVQRNAPGTLACSLRKVNLQSDPLIMVFIAVLGGGCGVGGANEPCPKYAPKAVDLAYALEKIVHGMRSFG